MSLIKIIKRSGPRTDPCETPTSDSFLHSAFEKSNNIAFTLCLITIQGVHMI